LKRGNLVFVSLLWVGVVLFHCHMVSAEGLYGPLPNRSDQSPSHTSGMTSSFQTLSSATIPSRSTSETPSLKKTERPKPETGEEREKRTGEEKEKRPGEEKGVAEEVELSPLEKSVLTDEKAEQKAHPQPYRIKQLLQFGYNYFRPSAPGFAPLTDIPVGADYVVGPGDRIILNLWGSVDGTYELEVNRSGGIFLPRVGSVNVWGITYGRLPGVIKASLSKVFKDFDLNVTMGKLRVMKVFVVGEVKAPGDYNLSQLSTLINALSASGGPLKTGTLRNIQIKRAGKVVETVDLYEFFLKGDKSRDIRLQNGDTIFVPVIGKVAGIAGNVKRPAIFELRDEKNLGELIALAGGFLPTGYLHRVQISRVEAHEKKTVADINIDPKEMGKSLDQVMAGIAIRDMDIVKVFPIDTILRDHVRLVGYVLRPGDYELRPGMRLSQLLPKDNLLPEYYKNAAEITRLYPPDNHPEKIFVDLAKAFAGDPGQDLELKEFDEVRVFSRWEMEEMPSVRINGEVQKPGEYRLFNNMTARDLIMEAGNLKITAYMKNAEINRIKHTGDAVSSFPITINLGEAVKGNPKDNLVLAPFDELTIRKIPNWAEEKERYVTLRGEFQFPGVYPIYKGERLSAVIERAGGFTDKAYLRAAKFTRFSIRELQQKRMDEIVAKTEQEILKKQTEAASIASSKEELDATKAALEGLQRSVDLLKRAKAEGRLVIRMDTVEKFKGSPYDVEVLGGDVLEVPQMPNAVNVLGQVYNPTSVIPIEGKDVAFYLEKAGGPARDAEEGDIYVVRVDGTVLSRQQYSTFKAIFSSGFLSTVLEPGDTIIVPQNFDRIAWMREIKDITTILSQIALTAGVMVAAGL
jgi:polysaccharide biosynthesis/export protein